MRRRLPSMVIGMAMAVSLLAACSTDSSGPSNPSSPQPSPQQNATHGPLFPECGGVSDQTVTQLTEVAGLINTARNSAGCQWLQNGGIIGPALLVHVVPRQPDRPGAQDRRAVADQRRGHQHRRPQRLHRRRHDPTMGDNLCEVGIQFQDDFIEWSISYNEKPFPSPCDVAKELTRQSIANAK